VHTGLNKTFISELEKGRKEPCLRTLETLAQSFDIDLSDLFKELKD
jgi:transcriptional regulator with XRE-family HTH domain